MGIKPQDNAFNSLFQIGVNSKEQDWSRITALRTGQGLTEFHAVGKELRRMDPAVRVLSLDINLNMRPDRERRIIVWLYDFDQRTMIWLTLTANEGHGFVGRANDVATDRRGLLRGTDGRLQ